ncbi:hypothetical protein P167DRAFT_546084 [Morchella conica CCBAS932]|uniref:Uncharacterized protein n=1 Tax=Morchella conica CCBAS932 TaxID=1392247 RepID=A0A3N4KQN3_9PEZI|nr:hypothetical protein P167DRAFT_546084 [Morchella conica CCBAS932]
MPACNSTQPNTTGCTHRYALGTRRKNPTQSVFGSADRRREILPSLDLVSLGMIKHGAETALIAKSERLFNVKRLQPQTPNQPPKKPNDRQASTVPSKANKPTQCLGRRRHVGLANYRIGRHEAQFFFVSIYLIPRCSPRLCSIASVRASGNWCETFVDRVDIASSETREWLFRSNYILGIFGPTVGWV